MKRIINVFISQPMKGKTKEQIEEERARAIKKVEELYSNKRKAKIIDSFKPTLLGKDSVFVLGYSIQKMSKANIVYMVKGWEDYNGCCVEYEVARRYGKLIMKE